jgi:hypothetical protein
MRIEMVEFFVQQKGFAAKSGNPFFAGAPSGV